jgi:RNA polymerase sigma-70 factor (ECF subfamily)
MLTSTAVTRDEGAVAHASLVSPIAPAMLAIHRSALTARARQLSRGQLDADDLVQDTLERALRAADQVRDPAAVRGWLFTILHRVFIDRVRTLRVAPEAEAVTDVAAEDTDDEPWRHLTLDDLRAAIARLSPDLRIVYVRRCGDGKSYAAIAEELGIPRATVGTRLLRARRQLREMLMARLDELGVA